MSEQIPRLRYQCRRGMLELDAILQPFFEKYFATLSEEQQHTFEQLLTETDQSLFSWFIGSENPTDPDLLALIDLIKSKQLY